MNFVTEGLTQGKRGVDLHHVAKSLCNKVSAPNFQKHN